MNLIFTIIKKMNGLKKNISHLVVSSRQSKPQRGAHQRSQPRENYNPLINVTIPPYPLPHSIQPPSVPNFATNTALTTTQHTALYHSKSHIFTNSLPRLMLSGFQNTLPYSKRQVPSIKHQLKIVSK